MPYLPQQPPKCGRHHIAADTQQVRFHIICACYMPFGSSTSAVGNQGFNSIPDCHVRAMLTNMIKPHERQHGNYY